MDSTKRAVSSQSFMEALQGLMDVLPAQRFNPGDGPTAEVPAHIELSEEQMRHFEQTGTVAVPMQTVGPTAKELQRRRLHAEGRTRQTQPRTRTRARGAGRPKGAATRSSARSGDSGEDGLGESSEPPKQRRLCTFCGREIPTERAAQAKYCKDPHADADRHRRHGSADGGRAARAEALQHLQPEAAGGYRWAAGHA